MMTLHQRTTNTRKLTIGLGFLLALFLVPLQNLQAQFCSPTATCSPGIASNALAPAFGTGIGDVTFGSLLINGGKASAGYRNSKCTSVFSSTAGTSIPISISTSNNISENVRVWVDWNNDETFDPVTELAFSSDNARVHTGSISAIATAVKDTVLRVRIQSDLYSSTVPTPCSTPEYGQCVDLGLRLSNSVNKPIAAFASPDSVNCTGQVQFYDLSLNAPSAWVWNFGDGIGSSTVQNPTYQYPQPGVYTIRLVVYNGNGSDTLEKTNYIVYRDSLPVNAVCVPSPAAPCCNYGISNFVFGDINTGPAATRNGYYNNTCRYQTNLFPGFPYTISLNTNPSLAQDTRLYIDLNGDGDFFDANEDIWSNLNSKNPSGTLITPSNVILNKFVRMRLISDYTGSSFTSCGGVINGAIEDFTVVFRANTRRPEAKFNINQPSFCQPQITVVNTSLNAVDSLFWDFGDGTKVATTSATTSVPHTYLALGSYDITLIAKGPYGVDTLTVPGGGVYSGTVVPACPQQNAQRPCCNFGIFRFKIGTFEKVSGSTNEGYKDFTCESGAKLIAGARYDLTVQISATNPEQVAGYLDANNDGVFQTTELLFSLQGTGTIKTSVLIPSTIVTGVALRLRLISDALQPGIIINPCNRPSFGQAEDYSLVFQNNISGPIANFGLPYNRTCRKTVSFIDSSDNVPSSWYWDFGDGNTSTAQNPTHTYSTSGTFSVKLKVANPYGADSVTKTSYLTILPTEIKAPFCVNTTANPCCNFSLNNITIGNVFNFSLASYSAKSYSDLGCDVNFNVFLGKQYPITISSFSARDNVAVYIDFNNNGIFERSELAFSGIGSKVHNGIINISSTAVTDSLLRMRVISEAPFTTNTILPCDRLQNGQAWDFGLIVNRGTVAPLAEFKASENTTCSGIIQFSDTSTTVADNWYWSFGDGQFSQLPNPIHKYTNTGTYTVKLVVVNRFGKDSIEKSNFISVNGAWGPKTPSCIAVTKDGSPTFGITRVQLGTINRSSGFGIEGYQDFTCTDSTSIRVSTLNRLTLSVGNTLHQIRVYVDVNDNGILEDAEALVSALIQGSQALNFIVNPGFRDQVWNKFIRMRIMATPQGQATNACNAILQGQAEDYSLKVLNTVGLDNQWLESQFTLTPNPTNGQVLLKADLNSADDVKIVIANTLGQNLHEEKFTTDGNINQTLSLEKLSDGLYYVHISVATQRYVKRLVLRH